VCSSDSRLSLNPDSGVREGLQMVPFAFRKTTPDSVRLVNFQRVLTAREQRGALHAHGLRVGLSSSSRRSALSFRMEKVGTRHSAASGYELPIPSVSVRAGKSASVCHSVRSSGHPMNQGALERTDLARLQWHAGSSRRHCATDRKSMVTPITGSDGTSPRPTLRSVRPTLQDQDHFSFELFFEGVQFRHGWPRPSGPVDVSHEGGRREL
jgi:hypothetical protein